MLGSASRDDALDDVRKAVPDAFLLDQQFADDPVGLTAEEVER